MSSKKIWQYPEATSITNDDYILMDSNTETGSQCLKANKIGAVHITKTVTERKVYKASDDNANGFSEVTVAVPYTDVHYDKDDIVSFIGENLPLKSVTAYIEPQQDLHGYDNPWAGGAGKNKLPFSSDNSKSVNSLQINNDKNGKYTISGTATANTFIDFNLDDSYVIKSGDYLHFMNNATNSNASFTLMDDSTIGFSAVFSSANRIMDLSNYVGSTVNKIRFYFNANQGMTGTMTPMIVNSNIATTFAPYSNICPISGWTEGNVSVCGTNVWDEEWEVGSIADSNGQNATNSNYRRSKNYISVKANKKYYFNVPNKYGTTYRFYQYKQNKDYIGVKTIDSDGTFETDNDCAFIRFRIATTEEYTNDISINYPSTDTEYHAYNGHTYTIDIDGTRYGGEVDLVSGVLTVDRAYVDLGSLTWSKNQTYWYNTSLVNVMKVYGYNEIPTLISSNYKTVKPSDVVNGRSVGISNYELSLGGLMIYTGDLVNPPTGQLVYELATPLTFYLDEVSISNLVGDNNFWADTGEIAVEWQTLYVTPTT